MIGNAKPAKNSSPNASMTVRVRIRNPKKTNTWAMPGTDHLSSFFCPSTSVASTCTRAPTWSVRPCAGCPDRTSPCRNHARLRARNPATTMMIRPTVARISSIESMSANLLARGAPPGQFSPQFDAVPHVGPYRSVT